MAGTEPDSTRNTLLGRELECDAIDRVLETAAGGQSCSVVLRGDPGIGKSALLAYAEQAAAGGTVLRTSGQEAESDLAFAGLYGLLRPLGDMLGELPEAQAAALRGALGLSASSGTDRLLVSAATLSLLAAAANAGPLVCIVDDVQWLDAESTDAILFSARRLRAERIAILFAARSSEASTFSAPGLPELVLNGLGAEAAGELLSASAPAAAPGTRALLLEQALGNPLALLELPSGLTKAELEGMTEFPESISLTQRLQMAFARRSLDLPADTRSALLILAVDDGDASTVIRAIAEAGLPDDALDAAEQAGLLSVTGGRLAFRHPLVRTAIHQAATLTERRRAHASLAAALGGDPGDDRRIWHQALATMTADEDAAAALEGSAARSQARGAHASAATAFTRAAQLTPDAGRRAGRLAASAHAAWAAGEPGRAAGLIAQALPLADERRRIDLLHLRGVIEARTGSVRDAIVTLLAAADASAESSLTLEILTEAMEAATWAGDYAHAVALGARATEIEPQTETDRFRADMLTGLAATLSGEHSRGSALLLAASDRADRLDDPHQLIWSARMATLAGAAGDGMAQAARAVAIARERGLLSILPMALQEQSTALVGVGRFGLAYAVAEEAIRLADDTGQRWGASWNLACLASLDALRGDEERTREHADQALELASASGAAFIVGFARRALGRLDLTLGRPEAATNRLLPLTRSDGPDSNPVIALWSIPDLIEAAARCGRTDDVTSQLERYVTWAQRPPSPARLAMVARLHALMRHGDVRERFETAVRYGDAVSPFQRARTELLFGEWLRREREPREARLHLRDASELFRQVGTRPWEARAEAELRATGETARRRDPSTIDDLTPQELQIAGLVAAGMTNRQIAAQLYLSPRTIEYHLRKVFMKLGLASRTELVQMGVPQLQTT